MTRHGKNNTASAVFTYAERQMAQGGTKRQRLGAQSMARFDSCRLCLSRVKEPRLDLEGHLFCNECVLENLLKQKKDIKRQQALLATMKGEEAAKRADTLEQARERVLKNFERAQSGIGGSSKPSPVGAAAGVKRKLDLASDDLGSLTTRAEAEAVAQLETEAFEARKAKLPNFWLPSLTPSAERTKVEEIKLQTLCHAGKPVHPLSLKELVKVRFAKVGGAEAELKGGTGEEALCCVTCHKSFNNNTKMSALRECGHVICYTCVDTLAKPAGQCPNCDTPLAKKHGVIELAREGTGFAAGGISDVSTYVAPAFQ